MDKNKKRRRDDSRMERNRQDDPSSNDTRVTSAEETSDALVTREKESAVPVDHHSGIKYKIPGQAGTSILRARLQERRPAAASRRRERMGRKGKCRRKDDSSSSDASSSRDEMCTAPTAPIRSTSDSLTATTEAKRDTRNKEDKEIKQMLKELKEDTNEMHKQQLKILCETKDDINEIRGQLKKVTESHNELQKRLDHFNGSCCDGSAAQRSESDQVQPPRYRLEFKCEVNDEVEKGQIIETKNHGKAISVALYDDHNQIVDTGPLASATVMLVVVNGEFNQHDNQYNWLRKDFERNIKRPRHVSATGDVNRSIESIVSNCVFKLKAGVRSHIGATILYNSSNKKVKLGVMVLSPTEERVLEGLSNSFFVRGHDRSARQSNPHYDVSKRQKQALVGNGYQERNGSMLNLENPSCPIFTQPGEIRFNPIEAPNTNVFSTETSIIQEEASILQDQQLSHHPTTYGTIMAQPNTNSQTVGGETFQLQNSHDYFTDSNFTLPNYSTSSNHFPLLANDMQYIDHTTHQPSTGSIESAARQERCLRWRRNDVCDRI